MKAEMTPSPSAERPAPAAGRAGLLAPPPAVYRRPAVCSGPGRRWMPLSAGGARHAPAAQAAGEDMALQRSKVTTCAWRRPVWTA